MKIKKNKFRISSKAQTKSISNKLNKVIQLKRKELQLKENIEFGRKAQVVTYQFASEEILR
jgi:hypothetical protein